MIECPACGAVTATWDWVHGCASCAFKVEKIDGFEAWAPELAKASSGEFFDPEIFKELVSLENSNFWFQARNELILWALKHYFDGPTRFAEIGCGTGFVLSAVENALPHAEIYGTDQGASVRSAALRASEARPARCPPNSIPRTFRCDRYF